MSTLPLAWRWVPLSRCCKVVSGATPRRDVPEYWGGDIAWVTPKDLSRLQSITLENPSEYITRQGYESCSATLLPVGSVLFSSRAPIGLVAIAGRDMATNQGFKSLVPNHEVDSHYLYWVMRWSTPVIDAKASGTTFKEVSKANIEAFEIPLPPLQEQRRIASTLNKADAIRRKRQEAIALTEQLLRSTFLEMFGDPVTNPKRWPIAPLHELATIGSGVMKGRDYTGIETIELPYMRVANVQDGYLALNDIKSITLPIADVQKYTLRYGDILLTEGGDPDKLGRGAVWRDQIASCVHQNHIFRVHPDRKHLTSEYLCALLGSSHGKRYFLRAAKQTTGIATINRTQLSEFPVLLPPLELQNDYSRFVAAHERLTQRYHQLISEQETLFHSLVQRAFSGQL